MKTTFPKIYPITDTRISGLSHLEQVRRLVSGGAVLIQLRDKLASTGDFYSAAADAVTYAHRHNVKIIINDRTDIALATGADGVHLGQDDLSPMYARDLLGPTAVIGFSTHSLDQARQALVLPIDYVAVGPIFATSIKDDHESEVGLAGLSEVRLLDTGISLVAIGGVTRANVSSVFTAGADCVALINDLVSEPDQIATRMHELTGLANIVGNP